jgi:hypothetical protein
MSQLEVDKIIPQSGTTLTLGDTGDTINFGSGVLPNFENLTVTGDLTVDTNSLKVDSTNNRVGIGTSSPTQALDVVGNLTASGTGTFVNESRVQQFASQSDLIIQRAQGSSGSPTAVANGQTLGVLSFKGYTSAGVYRTGSSLTARVTQGVSGDELPTSLYFSTTANGANSPTERMRITDAGLIGIGTTSPNLQLDITNTTGASGLELHRNFSGNVSSATNAGGLDFTLTDTATSNQVVARINSQGEAGTGDAFGGIMRFFTSASSGTSTERMRIDSSGNVGIGTSSPAKALQIVKSDDYALRVGASDYHWDLGSISGSSPKLNAVGTSTSAIFEINGSEKMRINPSGTLLVGRTGTTATNTGLELEGTGTIVSRRNGNVCMFLDRKTSNGTILEFRKDNSTVGSIGTGNGFLHIGKGDTGIGFASDDIIPYNLDTLATRDNGIDLGGSGYRFKDLYLGGGLYVGGTGTANKLDDYEEGTWTPTDASGAGLTFASSSGQYVKIGKMVYLGGNINYPGNGDSSTMLIGGLPFTCANIGSADQYGVAVVSTNVGANHLFRIQKNTTNILPRTNTNTVIANSVYSSKFFQFFGQYQTT